MVPEDETREKILKAAFERFSTTNYSKVSLTDIMGDVGISKGGLFHHFDSKYDLALNSLFFKMHEAFGSEMDHETLESMEPEQILGMIIDRSFELLLEEKQLTLFVISLYEEALEKGRNLDVWKDFFEGYIEVVTSCYERMGVEDPRVKAILMLASLDGLTLYQIFVKDSEDEGYIHRMKVELYRTFVENVK